jgi:hypothetical protein
MVEYMSDPECGLNNLAAWQTKFQYAEARKSGSRDHFWNAVLGKALKILDDKSELYRAWNRIERSGSTETKSAKIGQYSLPPTNDTIKTELVGLLRKPMEAFFSHPVTKAGLRQIARKSIPGAEHPHLPFLFIIDEAAYLHQTNYMHCFMWVLDQPVVEILHALYTRPLDSNDISEMPADRFFVLMLGTHSQISHFAPHEQFPSERVLGNPQLLPSPFLSFNWDVNVKPFSPPFKLRDSESLFALARWGRSMWGALFKNRSDSAALWRCVKYIKAKLEPAHKEDKLHKELSMVAVMSVRLHLDLDCVAPARASQLVCSKMRWLLDVGTFRTHITTTYGSEPLLAEAAACMMNSHDDTNTEHGTPSPPFIYIKELLRQLLKGYISRGDHGELTARLLRMYVM